MTRLSGIQLLAVSTVLWALAVWIFSVPQPAETETATATGTTTQATGEKAQEPGTGASGSAIAEIPSTPTAAGPTIPDPGAGDPPPRDAPGPTRIETAAAPSTAGVPATPRTEIRTPPAASGDSSRIALAPAGGDPAAAPAAASPMIPGDSAAGSPRGSAGWAEVPPGPARPNPWFEHPLSRPPPPARSDFQTRDRDPVAGQINAARRAAWEGRFADALSHYRAAARLRPNDYVVWGEMGNVLWTMRRWPEAAYALEGAATLLVRTGELRAASELVPAVGRIDPDAAYRVQRLLWAAAQRPSG